ncbi:type II secretion system F family protein [Chthonobacter rhizosphaerae]|uniref:type II secretion system F family protein n=1 Tax=Chthonobacter rhizosphaerae TaxID=2735553 RepID=UPI0015EEE9FE|nr:type II secretion system F family protein [Chthonobacter rhizosphaerae]
MFGLDTTILAFVGLIALSAAALAYGLLYTRISAAQQTEERLDRIAGVGARPAGGRKQDPVSSRRKSVQDTLKEIEVKQKFKAARSTNPPLMLRLQQAGMKISITHYVVFSVVVGLIFVIVGFASALPLPLTVGLGIVGAFGLPRFLVNFIRKRRQAAFLEELPNAVDVIVRGVKAGLPLNDCLRMIATEAKEPLRTEFRSVVEALTIGIPLDEAIGRLFERMPLPESNFLVIVISIQSKAGGNLSEALGNLSRVLRERKKMRAKIKAVSMEAKASASIIGSLPIIVMILVWLTSPDYISILWTDPRGQLVLGASALVMMCGVLVMRNMINFEI